MLRLLLMRHAKSSWTDAGKDDRDRPLTGRGKRAAQAIGRVLVGRGLSPDLVLCSPARRTRETWEILAGELKTEPRMVIDEGLYDFGNGGRVAEVIRQQGGTAASLLVIGHNPSLERLALRLAAGGGEKKLRASMERKYPTGALAVFDVDAEAWDGFGDATAALTDFIRPKDVLAEDKD